MSEITTVKVEGSLTPFQRDCITAALKWIMRIDDRRAMLPASFMDNCDLASLIKDLSWILSSPVLIHSEPWDPAIPWSKVRSTMATAYQHRYQHNCNANAVRLPATLHAQMVKVAADTPDVFNDQFGALFATQVTEAIRQTGQLPIGQLFGLPILGWDADDCIEFYSTQPTSN